MICRQRLPSKDRPSFPGVASYASFIPYVKGVIGCQKVFDLLGVERAVRRPVVGDSEQFGRYVDAGDVGSHVPGDSARYPATESGVEKIDT